MTLPSTLSSEPGLHLAQNSCLVLVGESETVMQRHEPFFCPKPGKLCPDGPPQFSRAVAAALMTPASAERSTILHRHIALILPDDCVPLYQFAAHI